LNYIFDTITHSRKYIFRIFPNICSHHSSEGGDIHSRHSRAGGDIHSCHSRTGGDIPCVIPAQAGIQSVFNPIPSTNPNPYFCAILNTFFNTSQVLSISCWVKVGWTKNIKLVSPNALAFGNDFSGRHPVLSNAFSK